MKLHIEGDAFGTQSFTDFRDEIGDRARAIGILVALWQETQSQSIIEATRDQIEARLAVPRSGRPQVFDALLLCGYLIRKSETVFEIRGNRKHVEALAHYKELGSRGGKKSAERRLADQTPPSVDQAGDQGDQADDQTTRGDAWSNDQRDQAKSQGAAEKVPGGPSGQPGTEPSVPGAPASGTDSEASGDRAAFQISSVPISSDQILKPCGKVDKPPRRRDRDKEATNRAAWEAYSAAYKKRHKVEPTRNLTVNCQLAKFVERVGGADAPGIAAFYVAHNDFLYVRSVHPVGLMLRDAEGLRTQWLRGRPVTANDAREAEKTDRLRSQIDRIENGELDMGGR